MIPVCVQTLIVTNPPNPCILVLCPEEEFNKKGLRRIIPVTIGVPEAIQLGFAMASARTKRPSTHDLFMDALTNLDSTIQKLEITKAEGKIFFAKLYIKNQERSIELDARPSDGIALALRQNAPIFLDEQVLESASILYNFRDEASDKKEMEEFHSFIENLNPDDFAFD